MIIPEVTTLGSQQIFSAEGPITAQLCALNQPEARSPSP